jgi:acyl-CoA synthetase (AMP-forming)/AMP-acid ligase II
MPLFHVGGSSYALVGLYTGGTVVVTREADPAALLDVIEQEEITHIFLVPALIGVLMSMGDRAVRVLGRLELLSYGASPMPLPLLRRCIAAFGSRMVQVYGMTEVAGVATVLPAEDHVLDGSEERLTSAGRPLPSVQVKVADPATGDELPPGALGELWLRTTHTMNGYWHKPEETAQVMRADGWLRTGDAAIIDSDGYVYIRDRIKDMIISGGENIYPAEVERVLAEHSAVAEVAVIGVPDDTWGEAVKAVAVPAPGAEPDPAELIAFCRDRLAHYKCPTSVDFLDALPRNPTGKILKRQLREPYWRQAEHT